MKKELHNHLEG